MPKLPEFDADRKEIRFHPNIGQFALAAWCAVILIALSISTFDSSKTAFREASILGEAEAPAASLIFTQRESLVYAARVGEWLGGTIQRREVQIARALLAQRLNVIDSDGYTTGQRATPAYLSSLKSLDFLIDSAPSGVLTEEFQHDLFIKAHPYLDNFIASARDVVVQYQQAIDIQLNQDAKNRASSSQRNLFLLYGLILLAGILIGWVGLDLLRQYRKSRIQIIHDTVTLERAQELLEELTQTLEQKRIADQARFDSRETMRYAARSISISIREFGTHQEMAANFCLRIGEVFKLDFVTVATFPNDRTSMLEATWINPIHRQELEGLSISEDLLRETIGTLWQQSSLLYLHANELLTGMDVNQQRVANQFPAIMKANNFNELLLLPIGEGSNAFGYVMVASSDPSIEFDEYSRQTLQFLSAHLAYSIIESELLATQRVVAELEALNTAKNDFISTVNHELRTPLTSIIGYIDLLRDLPREAVNDQAAKFLETLDRNALALLDLVESMLSLSRLDSREEVKISQEIDLNKILENSIFVLEPTAQSKNIDMHYRSGLDEGKYLVAGDAGQLSQVFINLISNAIKFSHSDSDISVELDRTINSHQVEMVRVKVTDHGIGIPPEDLENLFTRFFRGRNAVAAQIPGTGLGLAIVDRIVGLHGGKLKVDSTLGKGTTVMVEIPTMMGRVDALVAQRREGVLARAIAAMDGATPETLYDIAHEMAGAIGMYSFEKEGDSLRDFSHWLKKYPEAKVEEVEKKKNEVMTQMKDCLDHIHGERTN